MLFKLSSTKSGRNTHCGVLEFVADEGKIYLPYWVSNYMVILVNCVKLIKVVLTLNAEHQKKGILPPLSHPQFCAKVKKLAWKTCHHSSIIFIYVSILSF